MSPWPPERLDDRFKGIDDALRGVQHDIRVLAPLAAQVGGIEADIDGLIRALGEVRVDFKDIRKEMGDERASSRKEMVQLIFTVVGFFAAVAGGTVVAVVTGLVG